MLVGEMRGETFSLEAYHTSETYPTTHSAQKLQLHYLGE